MEEKCPECNGKRFRKEIFDVKCNGLSITDVLSVDVSSACAIYIIY